MRESCMVDVNPSLTLYINNTLFQKIFEFLIIEHEDLRVTANRFDGLS